MSTSITCPHCQHKFDTDQSILDAINVECGISSFNAPSIVIEEWGLHFRGWIPSANNCLLRGMCIASHPSHKNLYVVEAGTTVVQEIERGQCVDMSSVNYFAMETPRELFTHAVSGSMAVLENFINTKISNETSAMPA